MTTLLIAHKLTAIRLRLSYPQIMTVLKTASMVTYIFCASAKHGSIFFKYPLGNPHNFEPKLSQKGYIRVIAEGSRSATIVNWFGLVLSVLGCYVSYYLYLIPLEMFTVPKYFQKNYMT